jgi:8-oxo-dGTP pyrophosphatase MutT (NUDIX family)
VAAIVEEREGERRVFLARRSPSAGHGGLWELPGGKQEPGESSDAALVREIREELAVALTICGPASCYEAHTEGRDFVFLVYPSSFDSMDFTLVAHDAWAFFTASELVSLKLAPLDAPALRDWAKAQKE